MRALTGRLLEIASGRAGLRREAVEKYRQHLQRLGYDLSCIELPDEIEDGPRVRRVRATQRATKTPLPRAWMSAFEPTCRWLGTVLMEHPCKCGASRTLPIYECRNTPKRCVVTERDRMLLNDPDLKLRSCEGCQLREFLPRFITTAQLAEDIKLLVGKLPAGITCVAGISRSGLHAATLVSMLLHVPLMLIRQMQRDVLYAGNGWRIQNGADTSRGITLIVDDTVMTGNSLRAVTMVVKKHFARPLYAAVYVNPLATRKPDIWTAELPWPHLLEWNLFNSVLSPMTATDFDGVLCHDCPGGDDDDGQRYLRFLQTAPPKYLCRKTAIPLVVTARLEKYREETLRWLDRWRIRVDRLVMGPWQNNAQRARANIAEFKASHYRKFIKSHRASSPRPFLFVESDAHLARNIANLSGGLVVCPTTAQCFGS